MREPCPGTHNGPLELACACPRAGRIRIGEEVRGHVGYSLSNHHSASRSYCAEGADLCVQYRGAGLSMRSLGTSEGGGRTVSRGRTEGWAGDPLPRSC